MPDMSPHPPRVFRSSPLLLGVSLLQAAATTFLAAYLVETDGITWLSGGAIVVATVSIGALLESVRTRVTFEAETLEVRTLWGTRVIRRADIREVVVARGGKAGVRLVDDQWMRLPSMGAQLAHAVQEWSAR